VRERLRSLVVIKSLCRIIIIIISICLSALGRYQLTILQKARQASWILVVLGSVSIALDCTGYVVCNYLLQIEIGLSDGLINDNVFV
jgi:hypothetical protein